ncbi:MULTISPECIES: hypothetical protein [Methanobacterium]|jgi:hypothetical protein|uniref:Uncharacterized protein n=1 Tax=Methanobacterium veterum TaxID=408577 RepID=A0A9E4ZXW8_9EURY|nr:MULTISPECIES: hypothetical protein [Methanobacterium]MCZ3366033.1 hypothetical protein [Methanobacterium veterum]MCZ3371739.1 hypothetical protein [Methanobacterium veterum]
MGKYKLLVFIICFSIIGIAGTLYVLTNISNSNSTVIGSDNRGYVTKEVYASNNPNQPKIAVITGIHPREKIAISPIESLIKNYASKHDIEITDYIIHVLDNPDKFTAEKITVNGLQHSISSQILKNQIINL